jgi:hypothetical protein
LTAISAFISYVGSNYSSTLAEAASMFRPKKIAFINNLEPPSQKALRVALSAIEITRPVPMAFTTTAAEFLPTHNFPGLASHSPVAYPCNKRALHRVPTALHEYLVCLKQAYMRLQIAIGKRMRQVRFGPEDDATHALGTFYLFAAAVALHFRTVTRALFFFSTHC